MNYLQKLGKRIQKKMYRVVRETTAETRGGADDYSYVASITIAYHVNWYGEKKELFSYYKYLYITTFEGK